MNSLVVDKPGRRFHVMYDLTGLISFICLAMFNVLSFAQDLNAGIRAANLTILGMAAVGILSYGVSAVLRAIGKTNTENYLERARADALLSEEADKRNKNSLTAQNEFLLKRVNDINEKFHVQKSDFQNERYLHHEESTRLTKQLEIFTSQLTEALDNLNEERETKRKLIEQNRELLDKIDQYQAEARSLVLQLESVNIQKFENVQKQIENNHTQIEEIKKET